MERRPRRPPLHAKIGELTPESDFKMERILWWDAERNAMIDREHDLPVAKQPEILKIGRGTVYYPPRPVSSTDLDMMQRLDRLHPSTLVRVCCAACWFCGDARSAAGMSRR